MQMQPAGVATMMTTFADELILAVNMFPVYTLVLLTIVGRSLLYLILFVVLISFLGITTGIRKAYVFLLVQLFEWAARQERSLHPPTVSDSDEEEEKKLRTAAAAEQIPRTSSGGTGGGAGDAPVAAPPVTGNSIIQRKASLSQEQKLVRQIDEHNIHPLAQRAGTTAARRVASHSHALHMLAEQPNGTGGGGVDDAEYATVKAIVSEQLEMLTAGIEAIIEDQVTHRFEAAQLPTWNFLSRSRGGLRIGWRSQCIWAVGVLFRYGILFPVRLSLFFISSLIIVAVPAAIGCVPSERLRDLLYRSTMLTCMRIALRTFSTIVTFHDGERNRPAYGLCVANHTSPIDVMILSTDNCYSMVGQRQGGVLGMVQRALSRGAHHIWFQRSESKDRELVAKRLKQHVEDPGKMPILIFPEGTCINNTSVMLFKKGSFEASSTVCPIAMKYDNRLGDPFWNSHQQGYGAYLLGMMTSWALICDVWYLPPMHRQPGESAIEFARRCQRAIARQGGLVDLGWDGNLKRTKVPQRLRDEQRELFFQYLAQTTPICACGRANSEQLETIRNEIHPEVYQQPTKTEEEQMQEPVVEPRGEEQAIEAKQTISREQAKKEA